MQILELEFYTMLFLNKGPSLISKTFIRCGLLRLKILRIKIGFQTYFDKDVYSRKSLKIPTVWQNTFLLSFCARDAQHFSPLHRLSIYYIYRENRV